MQCKTTTKRGTVVWKDSYRTRRLALQALNYNCKNNPAFGPREIYSVYQCQECHHWHFGKDREKILAIHQQRERVRMNGKQTKHSKRASRPVQTKKRTGRQPQQGVTTS